MQIDVDNDRSAEPLARHLLHHALESGEIDDHTEEGAEWNWYGWTIEELDGDGDAIEVQATQETIVVGEQISGGRGPAASHPPEYEQHDTTIIAIAHCDFSDNPLAGECHVTIEQRGGSPLPPDPEPKWRDI